MHELSVALTLLDGLTEIAIPQGIARVSAVHVRVGALTGIAPDALSFSWELAADGTLAAGSTLHVELMPLVVACERCQADVRPAPGHGLVCPRCGSVSPTIRSGRELELVAMEVPE
ncbi:putative hydrogenase nickel incorporation protein HypA [Vulcanimicrobium alpinum]|uniref:Hydrogenase maturation factor HypA n=1 Tax=Vulcanimicrobium alpinum TaxID=3016050 RepID=A0AAN2C9Y1_UNVUL|nr:hydrogenase maturation nickel metallochaperone HypA [Vulcanimicrobium alpinum]BDE06521.1 putative hydrogenase nickel incorporation protein HypA [Vulcanimicrobium alpinum]